MPQLVRLDFCPSDTSEDLPRLDFTEDDDADPLQVHEFYHDDLQKYSEGNLSKAWMVTKKNTSEIVAFFTVSMSAIELKKLNKKDEKVRGTTPARYPAILLGRMGVVKKYRKNHVGADICNFCRGLAISLGKRVACRYVVLQTNKDKIGFYKKCGFRQSTAKPNKGLYWMYSRIV